jgi:hypothetical protein
MNGRAQLSIDSRRRKRRCLKNPVSYLAVQTADPSPAQWTEIRRDMQKPGLRYSGPSKAPDRIYCVMIRDTQSGETVGTDCYAVLKLPAAGEVARFDTYTALYVGSF